MKMNDIKPGDYYAYRAGTSSWHSPERVMVVATQVPIISVRGHWSGPIKTDTGRKGVSVKFDNRDELRVVLPARIVMPWAKHEEIERRQAEARERAEERQATILAARAAWVVKLHHHLTQAGIAPHNETTYRGEIRDALDKAGLPTGANEFTFRTPVPSPDRIVDKGEVTVSVEDFAAIVGVPAEPMAHRYPPHS